jgi:hypothetical protein
MAAKKRARKKVKRIKKAKKTKKTSPAKKTVLKKKAASVSKSARKKKAARKVRRGAASVPAKHRGDQRRVAAPIGELGEWSEESGEQHDRQATLFEDEIPPDYGGSK